MILFEKDFANRNITNDDMDDLAQILKSVFGEDNSAAATQVKRHILNTMVLSEQLHTQIYLKKEGEKLSLSILL